MVIKNSPSDLLLERQIYIVKFFQKAIYFLLCLSGKIVICYIYIYIYIKDDLTKLLPPLVRMRMNNFQKAKYIKILFVAVALLVATACGEERGRRLVSEKGMLALLPENVNSIAAVNVKKLRGLEIYNKMLEQLFAKKTNKHRRPFQNYEDFVNQTGIDLKKDVDAIVLGIKAGRQQTDAAKNGYAVTVIKMRYTKEKILRVIRENGITLEKNMYKNISTYTYHDKANQNLMLAFLSGDIAAAGAEAAVHDVIDIIQGTGKNVFHNPQIIPYLDDINADAVLSIAATVSKKTRNMAGNAKHKIDLGTVEAMVGYLDRGDTNWNGEIRLISHNKQKNQQLVFALNGLKYLFGAANPEFSDLINNINISASADGLHITATFPDAFLEKIRPQHTKTDGSLSKKYRIQKGVKMHYHSGTTPQQPVTKIDGIFDINTTPIPSVFTFK